MLFLPPNLGLFCIYFLLIILFLWMWCLHDLGPLLNKKFINFVCGIHLSQCGPHTGSRCYQHYIGGQFTHTMFKGNLTGKIRLFESPWINYFIYLSMLHSQVEAIVWMVFIWCAQSCGRMCCCHLIISWIAVNSLLQNCISDSCLLPCKHEIPMDLSWPTTWIFGPNYWVWALVLGLFVKQVWIWVYGPGRTN